MHYEHCHLLQLLSQALDVIANNPVLPVYISSVIEAVQRSMYIDFHSCRNMVGALNGALICMDDFEKAERIWENISYSRVMDVDDELMERLTKFSLKNISSLAPLNVGELIAGLPMNL